MTADQIVSTVIATMGVLVAFFSRHMLAGLEKKNDEQAVRLAAIEAAHAALALRVAVVDVISAKMDSVAKDLHRIEVNTEKMADHLNRAILGMRETG